MLGLIVQFGFNDKSSSHKTQNIFQNEKVAEKTLNFKLIKKHQFQKVSYTPKCFITLVLGLIVQLGFDNQPLFTQNTECDST